MFCFFIKAEHVSQAVHGAAGVPVEVDGAGVDVAVSPPVSGLAFASTGGQVGAWGLILASARALRAPVGRLCRSVPVVDLEGVGV